MKRCRFRQRLCGILIILAVFVTGGLPIYAQERDWVCSDSQIDAKKCTTFYDKKSVKSKPDQLLEVWVKTLVTDEEKKSYVESRKKAKKKIEGYDKLAYALFEFDMNCQDKKYRVLSQGDYDKNDARLEAIIAPFSGWQKMDAYTEPLFKKLCPDKESKKL